ncbi:MAG: glycosyltransferase family 87 protein [Paracoccaceae bacterium]
MQDKDSILAGDARLQAFSGNRASLAVVLGYSLTLVFATMIVGTAFVMTSEDGVRTLESDFRVFWATARIFLDGEPLATFDLDRLDAEYNVATDAWMPWLYPPGYLFLIAPFGAMSYAFAFLSMTLLSVAAMALASRPFVGGVKPVWAAMSLAPAYLPALVIGQNSLIWLAVLLAALASLRSGRVVLAGVIIGFLTLKPQLGLMIPFALIAAGQWRTIFAATGTMILIAALPTLVVGLDYWPLLAGRLSEQADRMIGLINELDLTVGPFFLGAMLGLGTPLALAVQWGITAAAALSVVLFWRSDRIGFDAKAALLMIAILLSAPYLWYYEAAMMAAIGLFMLRAGILTTRAPDLGLLILLWLGAGLQSANVFVDFADDRYLGAVIVTPTLCIAFVLCWIHFIGAGRSAEAPG